MDTKHDAPLVTSPPVCRVVPAGSTYVGKQGLQYQVGISAESVGALGLHMQLATLPAGGKAKAHKHAQHETAIYAISGVSAMWYGENLEQHAQIGPGDFLYIPANTPHLPYNPHPTEDAVVVIARTDPAEQESVAMLPHLDALHALRPRQD